MVGAMARHTFPGRRIETKFVGSGGATLKQLWQTGQALREIKTGNWDYVVLQEQSMLGTAVVENGKRYFGSPQTFFSYAQRFTWVIKSHGAEPVFFMTWSRQEHPDQQKYLTYAYMHIAKELRSKVAPAGMVWDHIRRDSTINLYQKDGSHPTIYGSYLAAATLFATIFDTRPTGLPGRLEGRKILRGGRLSAEKSLLCNLNSKETGIIQNAVADVVEKMQNNNGYLEVQKAVSDKRPSVLSYIFGIFTTAQGQAVVLLIVAIIILAAKGIRNFRMLNS